MIQGKIDLLCKRLEETAQQERVLPVETAMMALTTDIISEYSYSYSYNSLEQADFAASWNTSFRESMGSTVLFRYCNWLGNLMTSLPLWVVKIASPSLMPLAIISNVC